MAGGPVIAQGGSLASRYPHGKLTLYTIVAAIVGACNGLTFGYDLGVAGGVAAMPTFQRKFFPAVYERVSAPIVHGADDAYCKFDDQLLSLFVSVLFLAGIPGALVGSLVSRRFGRRPTMMLGGLCFTAGAALMAGATHIAMLVAGRIMLGLGVGVCVQAGPLFLSELAPAHLRGLFNVQFQLFITIGILVGQVVNYAVLEHPQGWRISLGIAGAPGLLLFLGSLLVPETPHSLIERGRADEARTVLARVRGTEDVDAEFSDIVEAARVARTASTGAWRALFSRRYLPQCVLTIALPIFNQFDGINAIMFYAPQLFSALGSSTSNALLTHLIIGAVNVGTTLVAVFTVDRLGRKFWLVEASVQMLLATGVATAVLATQMNAATGAMPAAATAGLLVIVCVFISGHAWGWGPMTWLVVSEVNPLHTRAAGTAMCVAANFLFTFLVGQFFLGLLCALRAYVFLFFSAWLLVMTVFCIVLLPETKGVPIEAVEERLFRRHRVWGPLLAKAWAAEGAADAMGGDAGVEVKVARSGSKA